MSAISETALSAPPRLRLGYLDGLRGLAALYVVLYHAYLRTNVAPTFFKEAIAVFGYGHYAVSIFIVLSGYCLMLPVARSADYCLQGGNKGFMLRRARRILPPYYASVVLSLLLMATIEVPRLLMHHPNALASELSIGNLLSHLFLVQNLSRSWMFGINGALWSIATEWQIYFLFALLLLPLFRRTNLLFVVAVSMALAFLPHYLLPAQHTMDQVCPWYLVLFTLGMAGAVINFSLKRPIRHDLPWFVFSGLGATFFLLLIALVHPYDPWQPRLVRNFIPWSDVLLGCVIVCLMVGCTRFCIDRAHVSANSRRRPLILRVLEMPLVTALGAFSYSLYLTHAPVLGEIEWAVLHFHLGPIAQFFAMWLIAVPLAVATAYLFHLAFERPFMGTPPPRTERQAEQAAIISPAP